jgi:hypothetical protein
MKKLFALLALLLWLILPAFAPAQSRLSPNDQRRFDSYYSRWQEYKRTNNHGQVASMERRMQDLYAHYGIPRGTPYSRVASGGQDDSDWNRDRDRGRNRDRDRGRHRGDKDHDRDQDRDHDRDQDRDHDRD